MSTKRSYCTFKLASGSGRLASGSGAGLRLALPVERVQEVVRCMKATRIPLAPPCVRGLVNLRGELVTAVDLRERLGVPPAPGTAALERGFDVVVRSADGAFSLLVDEVGDVLDLDDARREEPPRTLDDAHRALISAVFALETQLLLVLDLDAVLRFELRAAERR